MVNIIENIPSAKRYESAFVIPLTQVDSNIRDILNISQTVSHIGGVVDRYGNAIPNSNLTRVNGSVSVIVSVDSDISSYREYSDDVAYGGTINTNHFGHFIAETLSRTWIEDIEYVFTTYPGVRSLSRFNREIFEAAGIRIFRDPIISTKSRFNSITVPPPLIELGNESIYRKMSDIGRLIGVKLSKGQSNKNKKIYFTRANFKNRRVHGESVLEAAFKDEGFEIISPELLSFQEQVSLVNEANTIGGCIGSAMHNLMFAIEPKTVVYIERTSGTPLTLNLFKCQDAVFNHHALYFNRTRNSKSTFGQDGPFCLDVSAILSDLFEAGIFKNRSTVVFSQSEIDKDYEADWNTQHHDKNYKKSSSKGAIKSKRIQYASTTCADVIAGPSHTVRWQWHVRDGVVSCPLPAERIIGLGGAPVWSKYLFDQTDIALKQGERLVLMVPDFRFGNGITLDADASVGPLFQNGFLAINPAAMTLKNDAVMLERSMAALRQWHKHFGDRVRYVFWCLFGRQVHDRMAGHYIEDGKYHHPIFNYNDVATALPELDIVNLDPLLHRPMHDVRRLFLDSSSHPTQVGYLLLNGLLFDGLDALTAYDRAVAKVEDDLIALVSRIREKAGRSILLTGRSVWLDVLMTTLGATGLERLAKAGLVLAPLDRSPGQPPLDELLLKYPLNTCRPVVVSAGSADLSALLELRFGTPPGFWADQPLIDWESAAEVVIRARGEVPKFTRLKPGSPAVPGAIRPDLPAHAVEQGPLGMPSWSGLTSVLELLAKLPNGSGWRIEGDVLVTAENVAFLIGGGHSVLKFATGALTPTLESQTAFRDNIAGRLARTQAAKIPYLHVIFPDKQSVLSDQFPFHPLHRLGDAYIARLDPSLRPYVLWPADALKGEAHSPFLPLDTHMTDHGSLAVLRMMLQAVGIEADVTLARIESRIVRKQRWKGDLGSKLNPPLFQEGMLLDPDWPQQRFISPGGFNDGMVDVVLNPDAPIDKTVLLFGDSFFRMMLDHLGAVFTRVICLRTRFMHPEMLTLIRPDVVFTGNAERYLSQVSPDTEAQSFALYPHLRRSADLAMSPEFLAAWAALTAPDAQRSKSFFSSQGFICREVAASDNTTRPDIISNRPLRWLIATHHLYRWGGSELVAIELAEELRRRGHMVSIYTPFATTDFIDDTFGPDVCVFTQPEEVNLTDFDVVYCQHQAVSRIFPEQKSGFSFRISTPIFIFGHLSPFETFEFPGPFIEEQFADIILCNSRETAAKISGFGAAFTQLTVVPNPAPATFAAAPARPRDRLIRLLSVSSHLPNELQKAFEILSAAGVEMTRIGHPDHERRVTPEDIAAHDAVVTIGKTVQYALRGHRPVFCYDYFGGPGWLDTGNFEAAAAMNFSGRSQPERRLAEQLADEIMSGFVAAFTWAGSIPEDSLAPYRLETTVDQLQSRLLDLADRQQPRLSGCDAAQQAQIRSQWAREASVYELTDKQFNSHHPKANSFVLSRKEFARRRSETAESEN